MKTYQLHLSILAPLSLATFVGCTDGPSEGAQESNTGQTAGSGTTTTSSSSSSNDTGDIELTTGSGASTGVDTTGGGAMPGNGGLQPLAAEQITAIKDGACSGVTAAAEPIPPVIQLVVDTSGSMRDAVADGERTSKWDAARPALLAALDGLADEVAVGLQLFPTASPPGTGGGGFGRPIGGGNGTASETYACVSDDGHVPIAPLDAAQRMALEQMMNRAGLFHGTPTHDAYRNSVENGLKAYDGPGDRFVVLMTDGAPTISLECMGDGYLEVDAAPLLAEVTAAASAGIGTFAIGAPGSENTRVRDPADPNNNNAWVEKDFRPFLSEIAQIGGTAPEGCTHTGPNYCHFDMTQSPDFSTALADGLAAISDQVKSTCIFAAPNEVGLDLNATSVIIERSDGSAVLALNDEDGVDCQEGWIWNTAGEIELCPATCASVESDPGAVVSVSLGCEELIR